jgi:hypothetical protein
VVSSHSGTPLGVRTSHGHFGPQESPRPGLGGCHHHPPYSILCDAPPHLHPSATNSRDSRNCPEIVPGGLLELWTAITLDCRLGSRRGLNRSFSPRRDLSNAISHAQIGCREGIDSQLLVVGSQTASLTPGPSFAYNLGCRCPNCQCEGIFDIYVSRPFQRHQEHPNARCFAPCCRALNLRESRRTPNPQLFQVLGFTPTLGQSGVATIYVKNKGSNLDTLINALKSIVLCSPLQLLIPFVRSCFGHAMSKATQYATSDAKICQSFSNSN